MSSKSNNDGENYAAQTAKIEQIIAQIESGSLSLEEVFTRFATAVESLKRCEAFLESGKDKMNLLLETLTDEDDTEPDW